MSSTQRGYERHASDYYRTSIVAIERFLVRYRSVYGLLPFPILDPSAGGDADHPMSYPEALTRQGYDASDIHTVDIRLDSPADEIGDYLERKREKVGTIITNPPFLLAQQFAEKAMQEADVVVLLQRLNWLGSTKRLAFWDRHMPSDVFVHRKRMSFTDNGKTDSIEYAHFVWRYPFNQETRLHLI